MWLDLLACSLLLYFVISGILGGALVSFLRMFALVGAYVVAFALGPILAPLLELALGVGGMAALAIAGGSSFLLVFLTCNAGMWMAKRARRNVQDERPHATLDRVVGGALGAVQGAIFALLVGLLANFVQVGQEKGGLQGFPSGGERVGAATAVVLESTADAVLDEDARTARVAVRFAARPREAIADFETIVRAPAMTQLQGDPLFWSYLEHGSVDQALNQRSFLDVTHDDGLRKRMAELGMISPQSAEDTNAFRAEARALFTELSPRIRILRRDPMITELARDPEIVQAIQTGDSITLLSDARFQEIVARVIEAGPEAVAAQGD